MTTLELKRLIADQTPTVFENQIVTRHGTQCQVEWHGRAIADDSGGIDFIFINGIDITQKRRLEMQLVQAHKLEAIGTLAGGIAHDFNNILTPVIIHTEMALSKLDQDSPMRTHLDKVIIASKRARNLIGQILAFSRPEEPKRRLFKVSPIVKEALKLLRASLPSTIEIRQNIQAEAKSMVGDPTEIHQVLVNLCTNASYAMKKTGGILTVELTALVIPLHSETTSVGLSPGEYLQLTVGDTGIGMPPEVVDRIFEPYFTTKQEGDGTGLGLARVHRIVTNYGGTITVSSSPEKGSKFKVLLPVTANGQKEVAKPVRPPQTGSEQILFIDDEEVTVEAVHEMLEELGYQPVSKSNSKEALEIFRNDPRRFQLVITDQTMPEMTGMELAEKLLRIRPDIPIILSTGFSDAIEEQQLAKLGIHGFLTKPYDMHEFARIIRKTLDE
jgi:signal transduction histidine kinase